MLNQAPDFWSIDRLIHHIRSGPTTEINGARVPCRTFGKLTLRSRLHLAWLVFTGRCDALYWPGQEPKAY